MSRELPSGEFVVLGNPYMTTVPSSGHIGIEALHHACPKLPIDLPASGIVCAGELLIRAVPKEEQGSIHVQVIPEGRFSLGDGVVHVGRDSASRKVKYPVQPDGSCMIDGVRPGPFEVYVDDNNKVFRSPRRRLYVMAGQTASVELQAYACRRVVIDWKCHNVGSENGWREGTTTIITGESTWRGRQDEKGCAWGLSEWDGTSANIHGVVCGVLPAEPGDFDPPRIRASREEFRNFGPAMMHPIGVGKVFASRSFDFKADNETEAVIRIRSIEPVVPLATQAARVGQ